MTRFGFLSLALLSLQAFVGTGFAAVSLSGSSRVTGCHNLSRVIGLNGLTGMGKIVGHREGC